MPHVEASLAVIARALDDLGMARVAMLTSVLGRPLVDPVFAPIFDELDRRAAVLYLHPMGNSAWSSLIDDRTSSPGPTMPLAVRGP